MCICLYIVVRPSFKISGSAIAEPVIPQGHGGAYVR